jgi:predicted permease
MLVRILVLIAPVLLGAGAGMVRLFDSTESAVHHLNRYALYFAFPALVFAGIVDQRFELDAGPAFWAVVPVCLVLSLVCVRLGARMLGVSRDGGTIALVTSFGNVAYLGLPFLAQFVGPEALGVGSLAVALNVTGSMIFGPYLLLRWSGADTSVSPFRRAVRQPLLWAPVLGFLGRLAPDDVRAVLHGVTEPVGQSAAPVALFVLGLYLHANRSAIRRATFSTWAHVAAKLVLLPAWTGAACWLAVRQGWLAHLDAQVFFLLSCMPAAITTFAIVKEFEGGGGLRRENVERVTQTIVVSTLLSAATLPAALWISQQF